MTVTTYREAKAIRDEIEGLETAKNIVKNSYSILFKAGENQIINVTKGEDMYNKIIKCFTEETHIKIKKLEEQFSKK